jgi:hypothetical protein
MDRPPVHELSAVNCHSLRFKCRATLNAEHRPASRRGKLGEHTEAGRRDGGLKMGWTKPLPGAWPMGIDCRLDLWQGSDIAGSHECERYFVGSRVLVVNYDDLEGMRSVPQIFSGMSRLAILPPGLVRPSLCATVGSGSRSSLLHHEVSLIGVRRRCGLRGRISITCMRPW